MIENPANTFQGIKMVIKKIGIIANVEKEKSAECTLLLRDWALK
jgi:hypothetical protein